jgi:ssDNA-binding Zn-finger/Zn-ribbon topoisomerase 1
MRRTIKCPRCRTKMILIESRLGKITFHADGYTVQRIYKYICPKCYFIIEISEKGFTKKIGV